MQPAASRRQAVLVLVAAFVLALCLGAPFWLPWLLESGYGSLQRMEAGPFNAALNLVPPDQLFSPALVLDAASINSPRPLTLGLLQAVFAALGILASVWLHRRRTPAQAGATWLLLAVAGLLAISILLMLPLAAPVWIRVPLAKFIAFPWRLLGPAGLACRVDGGSSAAPSA